jgi:hypothetical protein
VARRNQNSFIKRQKELKRVRKAKEKMARRHGKKIDDGRSFEGPLPERSSPPESGKLPGGDSERTADSGS